VAFLDLSALVPLIAIERLVCVVVSLSCLNGEAAGEVPGRIFSRMCEISL
jgi:hypothetical protein